MSKNYTQEGIGENVEFGRGGNRVVNDSGRIAVRENDNVTPSRVAGAGAVNHDEFITLSQFQSCYVIVESASDLPPPDGGGVRTLDPATVYLVCGTVNLPAGQTIRQSQGSVLEGRHPETDILLGDASSPLVDGSRTGLLLSQLSIINASAAPTAACAIAGNADQLASPNPTINSIQGQCSFTGVLGLIFDNCLICALDGGIFRSSGTGIVYRNICANISVDDVAFFLTDPTAVAVDLENGSTVSVCRWSTCAFKIEAGQTGIRKDPGATLNLVGCQASQFFASGPPGTFLAGLPPDDQSDVLFLSNFGLPESSFSGAMQIPSNLTQVTETQIAGTNVFVRVGFGNPGHPLLCPQIPRRGLRWWTRSLRARRRRNARCWSTPVPSRSRQTSRPL